MAEGGGQSFAILHLIQCVRPSHLLAGRDLIPQSCQQLVPDWSLSKGRLKESSQTVAITPQMGVIQDPRVAKVPGAYSHSVSLPLLLA